MDTSKIVGEKIKALREDKSISIEELAQRSGLAIEQVERIENNIDIPSLAPLIKIARVLGVRLGTFLDDRDEVGPVVCRKKEAKDAGLVSPITRFILANTWNITRCPSQRRIVTWSRLLLM